MNLILDIVFAVLKLTITTFQYIFTPAPEPEWQYAEDGWTRTDPETGIVQEYDEWGWR